ncbi:hypothetical protein [Labrys wisconsinensis]|uniref:Uncharacterized protein n=1 Tax=Labrys wisconsinensis TaxID=425677 RepID=A0ABU0JMU6_9HYPH|nr:hypothetical protein [Labrys wisconsinensis]MDQ0474841.1 hypothetical protein [Labrys wisconsinensis]
MRFKLFGWIVAVLVVILARCPAVGANSMTTISGETYRFIEVAVGEMRRRGLEVERYDIIIPEKKENDIVMIRFSPPRVDGVTRFGGGIGIKIQRDNMQIISTQFYK